MSKHYKTIGTIPVQCGIYDTEYTLLDAPGGQMAVREPYIKWSNNTGVLDFEVLPVGERARPYVQELFDTKSLVDDDGLILDDYIYGRIAWV